MVAESDNADAPQEQEEVQPETEAQETPVLEEITVDGEDQEAVIEATQQSELIDQRKSGKPPKNFESAGNDILGGGFDLGSFGPR